MRIDITNEVVEMDGKPLADCVWVDPDAGEACIFCHDRDGRKVPTDTDPTGYETLIVKGSFKVTKTYPVKQEAQPSFNWDPCNDPYSYPNFCCVQDVDRDGRNGSGIFCQEKTLTFDDPSVFDWVGTLGRVSAEWKQVALELCGIVGSVNPSQPLSILAYQTIENPPR